MDRVHLLLFGLPLFLFCTDVINIFTPPPPKPPHAHHGHSHHHHDHQSQPPLVTSETLEIPAQKPAISGIGIGSTVRIDFCSSCSYKGNAVTIKKMLESQFPGIEVLLDNYPPSLPKRVASKLVPVLQFGVFGVMMAGEQVLPMIGFRTLPTIHCAPTDSGPSHPFGYSATPCSRCCRVLEPLKSTAITKWFSLS